MNTYKQQSLASNLGKTVSKLGESVKPYLGADDFTFIACNYAYLIPMFKCQRVSFTYKYCQLTFRPS